MRQFNIIANSRTEAELKAENELQDGEILAEVIRQGGDVWKAVIVGGASENF